MLKNTPLTALSATMRFVTPSVALVTVIGKIGTFYPPDGVDNGHNKFGDNRGVSTMVIVKQNDKWLIASSQATDINEDVVKMGPFEQNAAIGVVEDFKFFCSCWSRGPKILCNQIVSRIISSKNADNRKHERTNQVDGLTACKR